MPVLNFHNVQQVTLAALPILSKLHKTLHYTEQMFKLTFRDGSLSFEAFEQIYIKPYFVFVDKVTERQKQLNSALFSLSHFSRIFPSSETRLSTVKVENTTYNFGIVKNSWEQSMIARFHFPLLDDLIEISISDFMYLNDRLSFNEDLITAIVKEAKHIFASILDHDGIGLTNKMLALFDGMPEDEMELPLVYSKINDIYQEEKDIVFRLYQQIAAELSEDDLQTLNDRVKLDNLSCDHISKNEFFRNIVAMRERVKTQYLNLRNVLTNLLK